MELERTYEEALKLHKEHNGKLEVRSKVSLESKEDLSLSYTPGVAGVSIAIGKDVQLAKTHTLKGNTVAVVSDGSAILGLGNLGPEAAIPVMEGKAALFKRFANIDAFPICLATQDTEEIINTVKRIAPVFGGINLEDISAPRCFEIEARLRKELSIPVMHDDQHGTATVVLAGVLNALRARQDKDKDIRIVLSGAGAAGTAIAEILTQYGFADILVTDSKGIIHAGRTDLTPEKIRLATLSPRAGEGKLEDALEGADVFIGVSKGGALTPAMVKKMAHQPVIFAMANPVPEIMPKEAFEAGAFAVATGRSDLPNQINNVLAFPGIFRGALDNGIRQFEPMMFVAAAEKLAACVATPAPDMLLPSIFDPAVVTAVASAIRD